MMFMWYTYMYTHVHVHVQVPHKHLHMYMYMYMYICVYYRDAYLLSVEIYMYTCIYMYIHVQGLGDSQGNYPAVQNKLLTKPCASSNMYIIICTLCTFIHVTLQCYVHCIYMYYVILKSGISFCCKGAIYMQCG